MGEDQIKAYKNLAAAVLCAAIDESESQLGGESAKRFLTSPERAHDRAIWLGWLGLTDEGFQKLLRTKTFQGNTNRTTLARAA